MTTKINIDGKEVKVNGLGWIAALIGIGAAGIILFAIGIIIFVLLLPIFLAILGIWALNTLFHLGIAYNFINIAAGTILILILGGIKISWR